MRQSLCKYFDKLETVIAHLSRVTGDDEKVTLVCSSGDYFTFFTQDRFQRSALLGSGFKVQQLIKIHLLVAPERRSLSSYIYVRDESLCVVSLVWCLKRVKGPLSATTLR